MDLLFKNYFSISLSALLSKVWYSLNISHLVLLQSSMSRLHWWCYWKKSWLWSTSRLLVGPPCPLLTWLLSTPQLLPAPSTSPASNPNYGRGLWTLAMHSRAVSEHTGWEAFHKCNVAVKCVTCIPLLSLNTRLQPFHSDRLTGGEIKGNG